jgi:deoxyribose-phosphate aldolase
MIEHSLVRPDLSEDEVAAGCHAAAEYGIAAVQVRPSDIELALRITEGSGVCVASVVGFPHGSSNTATKLYEGRDLLRRGAAELSFVVNIGKLLSRQFQYVETEILQMAESCHEAGAVLKVIFENAYLAEDLKIILSKILKRTEADFAETSTCFGPTGYTLADVQLMRRILGDLVKVKACGGIRTLDRAIEVYNAGCDRIGCTLTVTLLEDWKKRLSAKAASGQQH